MAVPSLTPGRITAEFRIRPKALEYYSSRVAFGQRLLPEPFADWELNPTELKLKAPRLRIGAVVRSGQVNVHAAAPIDVEVFKDVTQQVINIYSEEIVASEEIEPARLGLRPRFVLERSSFSELFGHFRSNTIRHEKSWAQIPPYSIRDVGFASIEYGSEQDGLNLITGILKAEQAVTFLENDPEIANDDLRISEGCLIVDFDRYIRVFGDTTVREFLEEYDHLEERANTLATDALRGF